MITLERLQLVRGDDYISGCLLYYAYFKEHYKLIATDLSKKTKTKCWSKSNTTN